MQYESVLASDQQVTRSISRRDILKGMGTASAGALLKAQASPHPRKDAEIVIARKPVELLAAPVTPNAVRVTVAPLENGKPQPVIDDGSMVPRDWPRPVSRFTAPAAA